MHFEKIMFKSQNLKLNIFSKWVIFQHALITFVLNTSPADQPKENKIKLHMYRLKAGICNHRWKYVGLIEIGKV